MRKVAFTLAEVLITLGLIGAVSAIVIPSLAYNYRSRVLQEQFRSTYSDIKQAAAMMNAKYGDVGDYAASTSSLATWESTLMSYMNGASVYSNRGWPNVTVDKRAIYQAAGTSPGPYYFHLASNGKKAQAYDYCDNGKIWHDSKGRIWTFNAESRIFCVDINGAANPNTYNIDTFAFIPMNAAQVGAYVYDDSDNPNDYSGAIVLCDSNKILTKGLANSRAYKDKNGKYVINKSSPQTALDTCPFNAPVENIAVPGLSAKRKQVTAKDNYWQTYIDYK